MCHVVSFVDQTSWHVTWLYEKTVDAVLWMMLFVALIRGWNAMKFSGWWRPHDAKALNHTEKENPTTVFNMLERVLQNGSTCVSVRENMCVSHCFHYFLQCVNFTSLRLAWLLGHLLFFGHVQRPDCLAWPLTHRALTLMTSAVVWHFIWLTTPTILLRA